MKTVSIILILFAWTQNSLPQSADNYLLGRAYMVREHYDSALVHFDLALEKNPGNIDILYNRGLCHFNLRQYTKSHEDFYQVERRQKGMASYYLAKTEVRLNHPEQAVKYLRIHLSSQYKMPERDILLDDELSTLEKRDDWKALWNERTWYNKNDRDFQEALLSISKGSYLDAINTLNDLERTGYNKSKVLTLKAEIYELLGNQKAMMSEIDKAVKSDVRNHKALHIRAKYYLLDGKYREALSDCDKLIRLNPSDFDAYLVRAVAKSETGDLNGAVEDIDIYLIYFPRDDSAYFLKGKIQYGHNKYLLSLIHISEPTRPY